MSLPPTASLNPTAALDAAAAARAAEILMTARAAGVQLDALPEDCRPTTLADGYAIQDVLRARWGDAVAGWKTGATALAIQAKFGTDQPMAGPFFGKTVMASPASTPARLYHHRAIESEFAFRFGQTLAPRATPYSRAEIVAAVDAVVPAIEIVGPRFKDLLFGRVPTAIADCAVNAAFVFGTAVTDWRHIDLAAHGVRLSVDGRLVVEGTGANVLGDPLISLDWTVEHLRQRGIRIEAGQILSTGTTTGIVVLEPGQTAVADFGSLGRVELRLET
jgi:2-keto-4-pentenoate hydratase